MYSRNIFMAISEVRLRSWSLTCSVLHCCNRVMVCYLPHDLVQWSERTSRPRSVWQRERGSNIWLDHGTSATAACRPAWCEWKHWYVLVPLISSFSVIGNGKEYHTQWGVLVGCSSPLLRPWAHRWINHLSLWPMASCRTSLPRYWYQIILLGDRGTCVWTTCPRSLPDNEMAGSWTHKLSSRKPMP